MALCICSAPERRPERKQSSARSENAPKRQAGAFHPMRSGRNVQKSIGFENLRSEEHTSELQSLMRISYAVFCLKKTKTVQPQHTTQTNLSETTSQTNLLHLFIIPRIE